MDPQIDIHKFPHAPGWALSLGLTCQVLIVVGLLLFVGCAVSDFLKNSPPKLGSWLFGGGAFCILFALFGLGTLFANDQFEFLYVFGHGDAETDLRYKIAGIWAGQQGSFLLWAATTCLFGLFALPRVGPYRQWYRLFFCVFLVVLCGILAYETPFDVARVNGVALLPKTGVGLVPSLQNYWVIIHPPTIFLGFGSLAVTAAYAFAAMATGNLIAWVPLARPWAILSSALVGIGLCMGGFWAYETLGWGGFWMWDPVENVSFVPWLFSVALLHGMLVQQAKKTWYGANLVLAGLPFFSFCYGTFLTRSGFLSDASVHSFAEMNKVALWLLAAFVALGAVGYYVFYALRGRKLVKELSAPTPEDGLTREKAYASGTLLLCGLAASTAIGMSIPFFLSLMHRNSKVVEEGLYNKVVSWFFIPIMLLMAFAPFISWRKMEWKALLNRLTIVLGIACGLTGFALLAFKWSNWGISNPISFPGNLQISALPWITFLVALCIFVLVANVWRIAEVAKQSTWSIGGFLAHIGLATLMAGLIISHGFERKEEVLIQKGDPGKALDYNIAYEGFTNSEEGGAFDRNNHVKFLLTDQRSSQSFEAFPGFYYTVQSDQQMEPMVWPYLMHGLGQDLYFTLHPPQLDVWETPLPFKIGETKDPDSKGIEVTYKGLRTEGKFGEGRTFYADVDVRITNRDGTSSVRSVSPSLKVTKEGFVPDFPEIGSGLSIGLDHMDAADKTAYLQVHFAEAIWPVDLFYKPMVILVWAGAGIMTLGGFLAAFYRKSPRTKPTKPIVDRTTQEIEEA